MNIPLLRATGAVLAFTLLAGCGEAKKEDKKEETAVPVEVGKVTVGPIDAAYRGTATLEAEDEATVLAKTSGVIEQVLAEEGQRVKAGQVLARLETERLRLEVVRARAEADKARENFERNTRIYEKNLISKELYDQSRFALDAARAAHELAALTLRESEIRAPFDGVVSARYIKVGNAIQPNSPAFKVTQMDTLHAHIYVPERDIHKLAPKQSAAMTLDAWPDRSFTGTILRVNPVVDAATGTVKVTVAMAGGQRELKPGMFGRVEILYDRRESAVLVPKDAVLTEDAAQSVFVVSDGKARRQAIRVGYSDSYNYEVLEGLKSGDQVVTTGQTNLKDDAKVHVVNAPGAAAPSATAQAAVPAAN
ncbi:MAG: efflux RND transporter periplasmic adaptor subunit [Nevskiaceae bacterium]